VFGLLLVLQSLAGGLAKRLVTTMVSVSSGVACGATAPTEMDERRKWRTPK
jgi:hypothetical protein